MMKREFKNCIESMGILSFIIIIGMILNVNKASAMLSDSDSCHHIDFTISGSYTGPSNGDSTHTYGSDSVGISNLTPYLGDIIYSTCSFTPFADCECDDPDNDATVYGAPVSAPFESCIHYAVRAPFDPCEGKGLEETEDPCSTQEYTLWTIEMQLDFNQDDPCAGICKD